MDDEVFNGVGGGAVMEQARAEDSVQLLRGARPGSEGVRVSAGKVTCLSSMPNLVGQVLLSAWLCHLVCTVCSHLTAHYHRYNNLGHKDVMQAVKAVLCCSQAQLVLLNKACLLQHGVCVPLDHIVLCSTTAGVSAGICVCCAS